MTARLLPTCALALTMTAAAADRKDLSLTIYSSAAPGQLSVAALSSGHANLPGYALVRERRPMQLPSGQGEVRFSDVAKLIDPTTVAFASLTDPVGTRVIEQNFEFDLVSAEKLRQRYIGERITVEQQQGDRVVRISGILLSGQNGLILQLDGGEVLTLTQYSNILFPSLPGGLITKPTLVWLLSTQSGGEHQTQVAYQTQGMTWWADYNVLLDGEDENCRMDLAAWVTIVNQSGAGYPNAELRLVAGEVNRAPAAPQYQRDMMLAAPTMVMSKEGFQEEELFEYHLYTLGRRTSLPENSTKQLELFPAVRKIPCKRELIFTAAPAGAGYYGSPNLDQGYATQARGTAAAFLEFDNREQHGLGVPMPAGRVRVNQAARGGSLEFIGEDVIKHTPRNETLRLKLGEAFDIAGERKQVDFQLDTGRKELSEKFRIEVRNRKKSKTRVIVREYLYRWSGWEITQSSHRAERRDAQTVDFVLDLGADTTATVEYTVRYRW